MAYGASLESWLGASPHGFESHILRGCPTVRNDWWGFAYLLACSPVHQDQKRCHKVTKQVTSSFGMAVYRITFELWGEEVTKN